MAIEQKITCDYCGKEVAPADAWKLLRPENSRRLMDEHPDACPECMTKLEAKRAARKKMGTE